MSSAGSAPPPDNQDAKDGHRKSLGKYVKRMSSVFRREKPSKSTAAQETTATAPAEQAESSSAAPAIAEQNKESAPVVEESNKETAPAYASLPSTILHSN